jgi:hypothetical protein
VKPRIGVPPRRIKEIVLGKQVMLPSSNLL